ncbi:MAG: PIN/TRAM domain-containing protein [Clostridia bacterium]|nr:PIN/TRAM domain-containing protein [Clostridia bacterium]
MLSNIIRAIITMIAMIGGFSAAYFLTNLQIINLPYVYPQSQYTIIVLTGLAIGLIGFLLSPWLIYRTTLTISWFESKLQKTPTQDIIGGVIGLIVGLVIAVLLGSSFSRIPFIGDYLPIIASLVFGYLGMSVGVKKKEEVLSFFTFIPKLGSKEKSVRTAERQKYKVLDTSVIIDGRIADICKTGFLEGVLIIPGFVLEELRHIADSSDVLKRNRGRRGLDILNLIRKDMEIPVQIYEKDYDDIAEVDSKLVRLAQELTGRIITNDYNLNKVAELQGVPVLNINELANALKPVVLPGEEMVVQVIKDGKESGQGIGYLDDGTMIVVDGGKKYIGQTIGVLVTSVLQTAAGRMIFAKPKGHEKKSAASSQDMSEVNAIV